MPFLDLIGRFFGAALKVVLFPVYGLWWIGNNSWEGYKERSEKDKVLEIDKKLVKEVRQVSEEKEQGQPAANDMSTTVEKTKITRKLADKVLEFLGNPLVHNDRRKEYKDGIHKDRQKIFNKINKKHGKKAEKYRSEHKINVQERKYLAAKKEGVRIKYKGARDIISENRGLLDKYKEAKTGIKDQKEEKKVSKKLMKEDFNKLRQGFFKRLLNNIFGSTGNKQNEINEALGELKSTKTGEQSKKYNELRDGWLKKDTSGQWQLQDGIHSAYKERAALLLSFEQGRSEIEICEKNISAFREDKKKHAKEINASKASVKSALAELKTERNELQKIDEKESELSQKESELDDKITKLADTVAKKADYLMEKNEKRLGIGNVPNIWVEYQKVREGYKAVREGKTLDLELKEDVVKEIHNDMKAEKSVEKSVGAVSQYGDRMAIVPVLETGHDISDEVREVKDDVENAASKKQVSEEEKKESGVARGADVEVSESETETETVSLSLAAMKDDSSASIDLNYDPFREDMSDSLETVIIDEPELERQREYLETQKFGKKDTSSVQKLTEEMREILGKQPEDITEELNKVLDKKQSKQSGAGRNGEDNKSSDAPKGLQNPGQDLGQGK